ncbi:MAG: aryl-sulfate sulfotransferase, partial [Deltaproteobacteria bacterium]|nr:aryl-sulfate sulfotransferase [Deltaproteobacteria bacterium]
TGPDALNDLVAPEVSPDAHRADAAQDLAGGDVAAPADGRATADLPVPFDSLEGVGIENLVVITNPSNVLSFFVEWTTGVPASTELHVRCTGGYGVDLEDPGPRTVHRAFVMGFLPGASCQAMVRAVDGGGNVGTASAPLDVGELPDFLPPLELRALDEDLVQPGWTLFNLTNDFDEPPLLVVLVDSRGRYRWYHQRAVNDPGSDTDTRTVPEGVLVGGTHGKIFPALVSWEGSVLWEKPMNVHHDFRPFGAAGQYLMLTDKAGCNHVPHAGVVFLYDRFSESVLWEWYACAHIAPEVPWQDWSHLNTASVWPDGEHLLVSSRMQDAVYKVAYPSGEVLWKLGRDDDFTWEDPEDRFWQQHDPEVQPGGGRILLFDNGLEGERAWSRALELEIDEDAKTVRKVWEFVPDPKIFTPIWGDADRQPNGNTLITFGARSTSERTHLIEVTPGGQEIWHLAPPVRWGIYRSERVPAPVRGFLRAI